LEVEIMGVKNAKAHFHENRVLAPGTQPLFKAGMTK
jgi:hypothetical protein